MVKTSEYPIIVSYKGKDIKEYTRAELIEILTETVQMLEDERKQSSRNMTTLGNLQRMSR